MEIVIIGGIAAGMSVAAKARREHKDANITVIEKENYVSFGACGLPYYIGDQFTDSNEMFARTPEQILNSGINLLLKHEVTKIDFKDKKVVIKDLVQDSEKVKSYDRLMIASGASPIIPNIEGVESDNVYTITRLKDVDRLKENLSTYKNIVIVGGGFIGVEVSEQLAKFNKNITLLHSRNELMNGMFDPEFGLKIQEALEEENIKVYCNERATGLTVKDNLAIKVLTKESEFEADAVIFAVGFKPNTKFIDNQLDMLDNGAIIIDEYGRTSKKDVFAAGDCATINHRLAGVKYIPLATYANKMGRLIGVNIVSDEDNYLKFNGALGTANILAGNYEAGSTGLTEQEARDLNLNIKTTTVNANNHSNYYPNQRPVTIKLVYDAETFVLYGAQVFGESEAVLRLQALTTAIHAGLTTQEIGFMDFGYAPPFASTWEALNIAANTAK